MATFYKVGRAMYVEVQNTIRRPRLVKNLEKNNGRIIEELIRGVAKGIEDLERSGFIMKMAVPGP